MNEVKKFCGDCNTTKTPLWRTGPLGPRSLCNACGIRYRKRKMAEDKQPSSEFVAERSISIKIDDYDDEDQIDESLKMRCDYSDVGSNRMFVQRSSSSASSSSSSSKLKKQRSNSEQSISSINRNLGEVEQAAVLLMFLSCGSVFA